MGVATVAALCVISVGEILQEAGVAPHSILTEIGTGSALGKLRSCRAAVDLSVLVLGLQTSEGVQSFSGGRWSISGRYLCILVREHGVLELEALSTWTRHQQRASEWEVGVGLLIAGPHHTRQVDVALIHGDVGLDLVHDLLVLAHGQVWDHLSGKACLLLEERILSQATVALLQQRQALGSLGE